ncbi:MAG: diaminopimelate decarboxylase [Actinobacteria bacterium]|nr:diaminopimelate decarboxylase [Actinomycetota bacterium]
MTHTLIYPSHSRHGASGHLEIDGCDVVDLAAEFGTPLFIYEEKTLEDQCRRYQEAFRARTDDFEVIYASKAFCCLAVCQLVEREGMSIDVSSGGEYHTALASGFPTHRIFFHGNNKTEAELRYALENGVGFVVVDSFDELRLLERLAAERGEVQRVLLRITPGVEAHTHEYIQTGQLDSKFGFGLVEGQAEEAIRLALEAAHLDPIGVHAHIGSQIFELEGFRRAIAVLVDLIKRTHDSLGFDCRYVNVGGGLGIRYTESDVPVTIDEYVDCKVRGVQEEMARVGLPMPRVLVEPGRSLVGKAGITAYRVGTMKEVPGIRAYLSVDGGMSDNIRPMLYDARYEAMIADRADDELDTLVTVAGKHCESSDILIKDVMLSSPRVGDVLVLPATGAYCYAMASNYNGNPRPAVVMARDGKARVIVERETYDDLVARQLPLEGRG